MYKVDFWNMGRQRRLPQSKLKQVMLVLPE
jgi:hypothetical protein